MPSWVHAPRDYWRATVDAELPYTWVLHAGDRDPRNPNPYCHRMISERAMGLGTFLGRSPLL